MIKIMAVAVFCLVATTSGMSAKPRYNYQPIPDRHAVEGSYWSFFSSRIAPASKKVKTTQSKLRSARKKPSLRAARIAPMIVAHPSGCPRVKFCGCGASLKIYGKRIRSLYLARNWLKFPASTPGPGRVAVKSGHVFVILKDLGSNRVLAYDANSGGRKTRIHVRSLAGFSVRDPRG